MRPFIMLAAHACRLGGEPTPCYRRGSTAFPGQFGTLAGHRNPNPLKGAAKIFVIWPFERGCTRGSSPGHEAIGEARMPTAVEVLAEAFKDAGTPFIVGHPGGESVELMEASRERQMRFLLMKQEVAGAQLGPPLGGEHGRPPRRPPTPGPRAAPPVHRAPRRRRDPPPPDA